MNKNKLTLKEIAELAGTSTATVSRILNQTGRYSKKTEKKVLEIVDQYGYTINTVAKSLRNNQTKTIGLMVPEITNEFYSKIAFYCEQYLHQFGYSLFICSTNNSIENEKNYLSDFISKSVDGIIAVSSFQNVPKTFHNAHIPAVALDRISTTHPNIPSILTNEYQGSFQATEHLIQKGCQNIIALIPTAYDNLPSRRTQGFLDAMSQYNKDIHTYTYTPMETFQSSGTDAESIVFDLIKKYPIDGIYCGSDRIALGALYGCRRCHKDVPKDIKIIGFDNSTYSQLPTPSLSTIGRSSKQLSEKACKLLLDIINGQEDMDGQHIYESIRLIERESTKTN